MGDEIGRNKAYYYNLKTHQVEPEGQSKATDLLGPFPDPQTAADALKIMRDRETKKQDEDRHWSAGQS